MEEVSAIIVTFNSAAEIGSCLDSLRARAHAIVVDNASTDGTLDQARGRSWVEVAANQVNRGFAGGVNDGAVRADGQYLLLLNPDAALLDDLGPLRDACAEHGLAAGCLTGEDGRPQTGFGIRRLPGPLTLAFEVLGLNRLWPGNPVNRRYRCLDLNPAEPQFVEQPAGAFLMVRADVFRKLGGMDERFWPVWFEDVDFCKRAADAGFRVWYVPSVRARHSGAHSVGKLGLSHQRLCWYGSLLKYAGKHYGSIAFRFVSLAVIVGSLLRMVTGLWSRTGSNLFEDYIRVIRLGAANLIVRSGVPRRAAISRDGRAPHSADGS